MATYGVIGSPTYAVAIPDLPDMLNVLPDNSANLISAQDVRDVVAGLFEGLVGLSSSVLTIASSSVTYINLNPTSIEVGGIPLNSTFTGSSIQQVLNRLFYPYTPPVLSLSVNPGIVEYGNTSQTVVLGYSVSAGINNTLNTEIYRPLQSSQTLGTPLSFGIDSGSLGGNQILPNNFTIFTYSVNDINLVTVPNTGTISSVTVSVSYSLRRFWGTLSGSSNLVTVSSSTFSYLDISTLSSELNEGHTQSREIMTNGDFVVFIWPHNSVNLQSIPPKVTINGLSNNAWIKTRDGVVFTNQYGYTSSYDVWRFNNVQGAFTSSYVITI